MSKSTWSSGARTISGQTQTGSTTAAGTAQAAARSAGQRVTAIPAVTGKQVDTSHIKR